jgi:PadR family transcriptional regulator, regulatory protein PadR
MPTESVTPLLPKNFLRACLLLLLREQPAYGYELLQRLQPFGFDRSDPGGLYRTLRGLEEEGLVRSAWQASQAGPDRRIYELTRAGMEALHLQAKALAAGTEIMGSFVGRYEEFVALKRDKTGAAAPAKR